MTTRRPIIAALDMAVAVAGCEARSLDPDAYDRTCVADDDCATARFLACSDACGDMAVHVDEKARASDDDADIEAACFGALPPSICRTDAFSAGCRDGQCTLLDVEGADLGPTVINDRE